MKLCHYTVFLQSIIQNLLMKLFAHLPKLLLLAELSNNTQAILGPQATLRLVKKVATKRIMTSWLEACFLVNITL